MPAVTSKVPGNGTNSLSWTVPGAGMDVESVYAAIDATGAGGAVTAELTIADQSGVVIARKVQGVTVAAGGLGSATWGLRLDDDTGASTPAASGALTLIQKAVLGAPGTFNFTGFPATYNDLLLVMILRSVLVSTVDNPILNVNGDGSNHYSTEYVRGNSISVTASGANPSPSSTIGIIPGASADANEYGFVEITFRGYADTTHNRFKGGNFVSYCSRGVASFPDTVQGGWDWIQTGAITSIQITTNGGGNFTAGSEARLYGLL